MRENSLMIRVENVKKQYRLGQIGGGTLRGDLQSWWARKRGKEDPNTLIGTDQRLIGTTFMALNGVSFTVNKGEAVGIIGSNGAGKSTLLKLLTHVTAPTSGDIDLYGRVASMLEVGTGFHPEMTGRENVYLNGAILGMTRAEIDAKMAEIIEFSEVGDFIDTPVKRYSSGMFVKLAFSVAAHLDSEIMIMDEVLAVGDMKFQKKCLTKMRQAARRDGKTVLYVSHNMATIRDLCDRCIVLDKGKVIFDGDVDEGIALYLSTKSQEASFIDYSGVKRDNWFKRDNIRLQSVELLDADNEVLELRVVVRRNAQSQRTAGGKAASTDISAAVQCNHFSITFVHHRIGFSNAVFHAERVKRKPHITAGLAAELAHHRQVALIGADHHAAAKEIENRALGRLRMLSHDQAGKAVYRDRFIICLAVGGRKNATMPVLLFNFLSQCILRQGERLFRTGELVYAA